MKRQIVNIINFIRGVEPRAETDLITPVKKQIELLKKLNLKCTFLLQYDAIVNPEFTNLLKDLPKEQFEIGIWFELVQEQAEKAGIEWKGQYSWDYRANFAMAVGYTPETRKKITDITFEKFESVFGYYPKSVGSWVLDCRTMQYMTEKYNVDAFCNCRDQYGTDGYTFWGGYYGQGYYPSKKNAICAANTKAEQINTPVFRMLGSDPIYQYDLGLEYMDSFSKCQLVCTLEPACGEGGGNPEWIDWYFENNFSGNCLSFGYAQVGQENGFGWEGMKKGLIYQCEKLKQMQDKNKISVEKLSETGRWYKNTYEITPASTIVAYDNRDGEKTSSIWYSCNNYRINVYEKDSQLRIRDLHIFDENYEERYFNDVCEGASSFYDSLPVADGNVLSGHGILGGLYFVSETGEVLICDELKYEEISDTEAKVTAQNTLCGDIKIELTPESITFTADKEFSIINKFDDKSPMCPEMEKISDMVVEYTYRGYKYKINIEKGRAENTAKFVSSGNILKIIMR